MESRQVKPCFASSVYVDAWKRSTRHIGREMVIGRLATPVADISAFANHKIEQSGAAIYANSLIKSGIATLGQLLCVGTQPTLRLAGVTKGNLGAFNRSFVNFWDGDAILTPWPSPQVTANIYPMERSVPIFPWVVDCFGDQQEVNPNGVNGVVHKKEQGWTLELLLSTSIPVLTAIFESRRGRTQEIITYYDDFAREYETVHTRRIPFEMPVNWETYAKE